MEPAPGVTVYTVESVKAGLVEKMKPADSGSAPPSSNVAVRVAVVTTTGVAAVVVEVAGS
jgi:hypothetical protein